MEYKVWHFLLTTQTPFVQHDESGKSKLHLCFIRCTFAEGCRYEANDATHDYHIPDFSSHFSGRVAIQFPTVGKEKPRYCKIYVKFARHRHRYQMKRGKS